MLEEMFAKTCVCLGEIRVFYAEPE